MAESLADNKTKNKKNPKPEKTEDQASAKG
jgi:hypothetical protein